MSAAHQRTWRYRRTLGVIAVSVLILLVWSAVYLLDASRSDLRDFDPAEVARLETAMWRSYYERHEARLFLQLIQLLRTQFHLPILRAIVVGFHAGRSAFVFKDGANRLEYERALPDLVAFYGAIRARSTTGFDVDKAASLELEWWIIHRERVTYGAEALAQSLADLQAELFGIPAARLRTHGRLRAEAMRLRDAKAEGGGVQASDWDQIQELLDMSWRSLWTQLHAPRPE